MRRIGLDFSKRIKEKNFFYQKKFLEITNEAYFEGYFQSEKYFKDIKNIITKQFTIKSNISSYTNDLKKRINLHNSGKGAKFTRGRKWILIYKEKFKSKNEAISREYYIKNNRSLRNKLKNEHFNITSL